ncbi:MAG: YdbL family protein [Candidatus Nitronauta litoralis]|uniref:YdbL family protein n=1 Tax=Candidatus Nitronauta litoralis TaxID=2705533 RepID=A0A7T0BUI3_9BACT|nr:MAG: YdbL family protein [Candidatus Nitronauta litoralis]
MMTLRSLFKTSPFTRVMLACLCWATLGACAGKLADVNVTVVDQKTALENQVLGSYEELGEDVMLLASVRSVDESGKLKTVREVPPGKMKAVRAKQRQEFNQDDVQQFKADGAAGEGNNGYLVFLETVKTKTDAAYKKFVQSIVTEENEDRRAIYERIVATNAAFNEGDLPKVEKISASLNRDSAKPGEKIQLDNGTWSTKK